MKKLSRKAAKSARNKNSLGRRLVRPDEDTKRISAPKVSSLPPAPNIPELARRGGLGAPAVPFTLDNHKGKLYLSASGNSTGTVKQFTVLGLAKLVDDARLFCRTFSDSDSELVAEKFPTLRVKGPVWT